MGHRVSKTLTERAEIECRPAATDNCIVSDLLYRKVSLPEWRTADAARSHDRLAGHLIRP